MNNTTYNSLKKIKNINSYDLLLIDECQVLKENMVSHQEIINHKKAIGFAATPTQYLRRFVKYVILTYIM
jgi:superfamily II DNA or RNA helicase